MAQTKQLQKLRQRRMFRTMTKDEQRQNLGLVVARSLRDKSFKTEFKQNPRRVLEANGVYPPEGVEIVVVENTDARIHLVLPSLPLPSAPTYEDMEDLESRTGSVGGNTPKDKGCCGGGSSVKATWLEVDDESPITPTAPILGEELTTK
jgi:hypothetical protein